MQDIEQQRAVIEFSVQFMLFRLKLEGLPTSDREACLTWLDQWIIDQSNEPTEENRQQTVTRAGSYLGHVLCEDFDGEWVFEKGAWCVQVGTARIYPFGKVRKHFDGIGGESAFGFYDAIPHILRSIQSRNDEQDTNE